MDADTAMRLLSEMLIASAKVAAPILIITLVVGLAISVLQVVTQVQEMTLTFVPKVIAVVLVCIVLGSWMLAVMVDLATRMFEFAGTL